MQVTAKYTHDDIPPLPGVEEQPKGAPEFGIPRFFYEERRHTAKDGTITTENVEFVEISLPGDNKMKPIHKVTDLHRQRYWRYYQLFRQGVEEGPVGTPLEAWPGVDTHQVRELKAANIFTVEQLAQVSDANVQRIPFGLTMRENAKRWLAAKKDADAIEAARAHNDAIQTGFQQMQEQMQEMMKRLDHESAARKAAEDRYEELKAQQPPQLPVETNRKEAAPEAGDDGTLVAPPSDTKRGPGRPRKQKED